MTNTVIGVEKNENCSRRERISGNCIELAKPKLRKILEKLYVKEKAPLKNALEEICLFYDMQTFNQFVPKILN